MLYIQKEKRKQLLVLGFIGMALFAVGDVLLQSLVSKEVMLKIPIFEKI